MKKTLILFLIILAIAIFFRFYNLGVIPVSMSDDEIRESMSSYSFLQSGKDLFGMAMPFSFNLDGFAFGPTTIYIVSLFIGIFGLTMWGVRVGYAVAGVLGVVGVYFLSYELFRNKYVALISMLAIAVSVWGIQVSRFAHEGVFSLTFMIYSTLFLMRAKRMDNKNLLIGLFLFFCTFYTYAAIKVVVVPAIVIILFFKLKEWNRQQFVVVFISIAIIIGSFFILSKVQNAAAYGAHQFFFMDNSTVSREVELQRRHSYAPLKLKEIFHNKYTYWFEIAANNYLYAFSPQFLFISQEASGIYSLWDRGQLYIIELPFLLIGILFAFVTYRKKFFLMLSLLLIAPLPSTIGTMPTSYAMRSVYMMPFLYIFVGLGIYGALSSTRNKKIRNIILIFLVFGYLYSIAGYFVQYNYDWKIYNSSYFAKGTYDALDYIDRNANRYEKIIFVEFGKNSFLHYAFIHKLPIENIQKVMNSKDTVYNNINFLTDCLGGENSDPYKLINEKTLYIAPVKCHKKSLKKAIIKDMPGREIVYGIY